MNSSIHREEAFLEHKIPVNWGKPCIEDDCNYSVIVERDGNRVYEAPAEKVGCLVRAKIPVGTLRGE